MPAFIVFLFLLLLTACGGPQRLAQTQSGMPEITIHTIDLDLVKSLIIHQMQNGGGMLQDESTYRLFFTKPLEGTSSACC